MDPSTFSYTCTVALNLTSENGCLVHFERGKTYTFHYKAMNLSYHEQTERLKIGDKINVNVQNYFEMGNLHEKSEKQ